MKNHSVNHFNRFISLILLLGVLCSLLCGCFGGPKPEQTVAKLEKALNQLDTKAFLDCLSSEWAQQVEFLLTLTVGSSEMDVSSFLNLAKLVMPALPYLSDGAIGKEDIPKLTLKVLDQQVHEDTAVVDVSGKLNWGEISEPFAMTFDMKLENDVWVICGIH